MKKYVIEKMLLTFVLVFIFTYLVNLPKIVLNGDSFVVLEYGEDYKEQGAYLSKFGQNLSDNMLITSNLNVDKLGIYEIIYKYKLSFLTLTKKRIVEVVDNEKPVITLTGDNVLGVCPNTPYVEEGFQAIDNYDGDITDKVIRTEEDHVVIYTVTDSSGNTESVSRQVNEVDVDNPILTLSGSEIVYLVVDSEYEELGYTATDNCDGDLTSKVVVTSNIDTSKKGDYEVKYEVTDSSGNKVEKIRKVSVYAKPNTNMNGGASGVIYLTFDDGPSSYTNKILDILKKYNVKATFFVTNKGSDSILLREYQEGHTIGLHTNSHNYSYVYSSIDNYFNDLYAVSNRVKRVTGYDSKIIRFPGGSSNTVSKKYSVGIMTALTNEVLSRGYKYYDWNISSGDAGGTTSATGVYNNTIRSLSKSRPNMVLMHDTKSYTANAIESIIVYGLNNGYRFEAINENTTMITHKVNN